MIKRKFCLSIVAVCVVLLLAYEFIGLQALGITLPEHINEMVGVTFTRGLGGLAFTVFLLYMGYHVMNPIKKPFGKALIFAIPAFLVAINNLPIIPLLSGTASVTGKGSEILLLVLQCFCVGLFEEMAFRGVVFLSIMEKRRNSIKGIFLSIILSSVVFGIIHLINIFYSSPGAVFMQIGYSFLIGAMCSVVLIKTANIWLCVVIHALFNFCGSLVPTLGQGTIWDTPTIAITTVLAVLVGVYYIIRFVKLDVKQTDRLYG